MLFETNPTYLTNPNRLNPLKISLFLETDRPEGFKIYLPSTNLYYQNHRKNYVGINNPDDIDCRKHGWCDLLAKTKSGTINYYKFFTRGDFMSIGMIEKWANKENNHRVIIFEQGCSSYVDVSMDFFSKHWSLFAEKESLELVRLSAFPTSSVVKLLEPKKFNIFTYERVNKTIKCLNIRPHEYLKYKSSGNVWNLFIGNKPYTFKSCKAMYDFMTEHKMTKLTYEYFRKHWDEIETVNYYICKDKTDKAYMRAIGPHTPKSIANAMSCNETIEMPLATENKSEVSVLDTDGLNEVNAQSNEPKALETVTNQNSDVSNNNEEHTYVTLSNKSVGTFLEEERRKIEKELLDYGMDLSIVNDLDYQITQFLRNKEANE